MFRKALAEDLKQLFGIKKVVFDASEFGEEQYVLYCDVTSTDNRIKKGEAYSRVKGTLSILAPSDANPYGFFSKKIIDTPQNRVPVLNRFWFSANETASNANEYARMFNSYTLEFTYNFREQYNPVSKPITILKLIVNLFKGV